MNLQRAKYGGRTAETDREIAAELRHGEPATVPPERLQGTFAAPEFGVAGQAEKGGEKVSAKSFAAPGFGIAGGEAGEEAPIEAAPANTKTLSAPGFAIAGPAGETLPPGAGPGEAPIEQGGKEFQGPSFGVAAPAAAQNEIGAAETEGGEEAAAPEGFEAPGFGVSAAGFGGAGLPGGFELPAKPTERGVGEIR